MADYLHRDQRDALLILYFNIDRSIPAKAKKTARR